MGAATSDVFRAIADPTRREILRRLTAGPQTVGDICGYFALSQPSISAHLEVLRDVGLVRVEPQGRFRHYVLEPAPLAAVADWLGYFEQLWSQSLKRLGEALDEEPEKPAPVRRRRGRRG
jgi:DNA-binding transcriptional ArsR family regulator